jgi:hypothetical protein
MALRQDATSDASHEDDAEWESIARESLTNEDLDAVAEYFRSTGQDHGGVLRTKNTDTMRS